MDQGGLNIFLFFSLQSFYKSWALGLSTRPGLSKRWPAAAFFVTREPHTENNLAHDTGNLGPP